MSTLNSAKPDTLNQDQAGADVGLDPLSAPSSSRPVRKKKSRPGTTRELIAITIASRRPVHSSKDLLLLKDSPSLSSEECSGLVTIASRDAKLDSIRAVVLSAAVGRVFPSLMKVLLEFVRDACCEHDIARALAGREVLFPDDDSVGPGAVRAALSKIRASREARLSEIRRNPSGSAEDRRRAANQLRDVAENLSFTAIAWNFLKSGLDEPALLELVADKWRPRRRQTAAERSDPLFLLLGKTGSKGGTRALIGAYEDRLASQRALFSAAQNQAEQLALELEGKKSAIDQLHSDLEQLELESVASSSRVTELEQRIHHLEETARTRAVHHTDDLVRLRTRNLRLLEDEKAHLADSLSALRGEPPKTSVAVSYLSTIYDRIDAEIARLREHK